MKPLAPRVLCLVLALSGGALQGCGCGEGKVTSGHPVPDAGEDGGGVDGAVSDGGDRDGGVRVPRGVYFQPAAGGTVEGAGLRVRLGVGAPEPLGEAAGASHGATLGPAAARR